MSALVQYRDLPGGPTHLKFCDELSRYCLCTNCGMLSMSMLQDENRHMFCEACLMEASDKYHREHIYCSYENKQVSIFQMFEAHDLITVIQEQYVICPNPKCKTAVTLHLLKDHYMQCQPTVTCPACDQQIETAEWRKHNEHCVKQGGAVSKAVLRAYGLSSPSPSPATMNENRNTGDTSSSLCFSTQLPQAQGAVPKAVQHPYGILSPMPSPAAMDGNRNTGDTSSSLCFSTQLQQAQKPTNDDVKIVLCEYCERKLKERNMDLHLQACLKAPEPCIYCENYFSRDAVKSHATVCHKNPDNAHKGQREKSGKGTNINVACGSHVSGGEPQTYASVVRNGKHAGGNSTTTRPQPKASSTSGIPGTGKEGTVAIPTEPEETGQLASIGVPPFLISPFSVILHIPSYTLSSVFSFFGKCFDVLSVTLFYLAWNLRRK